MNADTIFLDTNIILASEDMQHGFVVDAHPRIENPFLIE